MISRLFICFILIFLCEKILNIDCDNAINGKSRNDCFTNSTSDKYCCYNPEKKTCSLVEKKDLYKTEFDCGISEDNYGKYEFQQYHPDDNLEIGFQTCGNKIPEKFEDCFKYSEITNSCCYFTKGDKKACLFIGKKYDTKGKENSYKIGEEDIKFQCFSFNIIFNFYSIFLILLFL